MNIVFGKKTPKVQFERQTNKVDVNSWHYKVYSWYCKISGVYLRGRETHCRYWRIVAFWAPLAWLLQGHIGKLKAVTPITITTVLATITLSIYMISDSITTADYVVSIGLALYLVIGAILGSLFLGSYDSQEDADRGSIFFAGFLFLLSPLVFSGLVLTVGAVYILSKMSENWKISDKVNDTVINILIAIDKFLNLPIWRLKLWQIAVLAFIGYLFYLFPLQVAGLVIAIVVTVVVLILAIVLWEWSSKLIRGIKTRRAEKRALEHGEEPPVQKERGMSFGTILWNAAKDFYYKRCPYYDFFDSHETLNELA